MTRRLVLVIVATVAATLLLVGGTTLVFATLQARSRTEADLKELAASINEGLAQSGPDDGGRPARRPRPRSAGPCAWTASS